MLLLFGRCCVAVALDIGVVVTIVVVAVVAADVAAVVVVVPND